MEGGFNDRPLGRRRASFFRSVLIAIGVSTLIVGCGASENRGSPTSASTVPEPPGIWHINGAINDNHGHKVTLNWGQIEEGHAVSLPFHGGIHSHLVTLVPEELGRIRDGERVVQTCSPGGEHTHIVMFSWPDNFEKGTP